MAAWTKGKETMAPQRTLLPALAVTGAGWERAALDFLATPTAAGLVGLMGMAWQGAVYGTPPWLIALFVGGTLIAAADVILGVRRAVREDRFLWRGLVSMTWEKFVKRIGEGVLMFGCGLAVGRPYEPVGAMLFWMAFCVEAPSAVGHLVACNDPKAETSFFRGAIMSIARYGEAARRFKFSIASLPSRDESPRVGSPGWQASAEPEV